MAQYGFAEMTVLNPDGSPANGVTLVVRKLGAQIRGNMGASPYTVDDVGATTTGSSVAIWSVTNKTETSTATATVNSGTSIGTAPNLGAASDDDILTIVSPAPVIYEDANGGSVISATLTTNSQGKARFFAEAGAYHIKQSGGGLQAELHTLMVEGQRGASYVFDSSTAVGYRRNIINAANGSTVATAGAVIEEWCNAGTRKASIDKDGDYTGTDVHVTNIDTSGTLAVGTNATVGGTLGVSGASTLAALTASGLITGSAGLTISAGAVTLPASSLAVAALASGITSVTSALQGAAFTGTGAAGTITGCTINPTIASTSSVLLLLGYADLVSNSGAVNDLVVCEIYNGATPLASGVCTINSGANNRNTMTLFHIQTGISGAQTYTLAMNAANRIQAVANRGRIVCIELKK